ncbi:flavin monoamine oxidase family protein [Streptomyces justiciae]|uniref:flavin monoamine oxidase family protein n=1 Tax=Streptomyces justiciae TaxID=2780140 RepID=UPI00187E68AE|nr:FAD-dependent oxidoreductase [Streptomyces justiciae]MBE8474860.1 FAD-dependent oxidoreductase [Streptomyces justiciae]MCW8380838.1 FAD-dependent oxidoreductase [Streptomyces justiciae]
MTEHDRHDVVVIGAGIAGLAATAALVAAGRDTVCLEARGRVGGRLLSAAAPPGALDLGATWYWDGEPRVADLAARLGIATFEQHLAGDTLVQDTAGVRRLPGNLLDAPARRFTPGADTLAHALAAQLPTDAVRLDSPVTAIHPGEGGALEVRTPTRVLHTDQVIVAVPPALALANIDFGTHLSPGLVRLARATPVWMGAVAKVVARYPSAFWREAGLAGAAFSRTGPLQELHDMSGPDARPAALFGFAAAQALGPDFAPAVTAQLAQLFGPDAAEPEALHIQDWSSERWTAPPAVHQLADYSLFGHPLYQQPALDGRLHWASTETAAEHAGHIEGALAAAERAVAASLTTEGANSCSG